MALEMKGECALPVPQAELWRLLNDPAVLAKIIPGCNSVRAVGTDRYEMGLKLQVGSVSGEYMGSVAIIDKQEPLHYVLTVEGQGSIGFMKGSAAFDLEPQGEGESLLRYAGSAEVGGVVAGVGQRVLSGVAKFLAGRFLKALAKHIEESRGEAEDATAA
jgi:carbon monoxide dehydrogenase subunit G